MRKKILYLILFVLPFSGNSQTTYNISWEQGTFTPLSEFTSILEENLQYCIWFLDGPTLSFGFDFPFFGELYPDVWIDSHGVGLFTDDDPAFSLSLFAGEYENFGCDFGMIISDRRYFQGIINDKKVLVLEWYNVCIADDIDTGTPTEHHINFQTWFFEDGTIELHFGDIDLENTSFYEGGTGFMWENGEVYGPWVGINDPEETTGVFYTGNYENPVIETDPDEFDILFDIPPPGWIVRWEIEPDATKDAINDSAGINIFPLVANDYLNWEMNDGSQAIPNYISVTNSIGQTIFTDSNVQSKGQINTTNYESGVYYVSFWNSSYMYSAPFVIRK